MCNAPQLEENAELAAAKSALEVQVAEMSWQLEALRAAAQEAAEAPSPSPTVYEDVSEEYPVGEDVASAEAQMEVLAAEARRLSGLFEAEHLQSLEAVRAAQAAVETATADAAADAVANNDNGLSERGSPVAAHVSAAAQAQLEAAQAQLAAATAAAERAALKLEGVADWRDSVQTQLADIHAALAVLAARRAAGTTPMKPDLAAVAAAEACSAWQGSVSAQMAEIQAQLAAFEDVRKGATAAAAASIHAASGSCEALLGRAEALTAQMDTFSAQLGASQGGLAAVEGAVAVAPQVCERTPV